MKILLTSGGTKVKLDKVRSITNMSRGTFGSKICEALLEKGHEVDFLMAEGSKTPFEFRFHAPYMANDHRHFYTKTHFFDLAKCWAEFVSRNGPHYHEYLYKTFDGYYSMIRMLLNEKTYDMVILAAAVSDYGVKNYVDGKIRSSDALNIELVPYPKIISEVKGLQPNTFLVGFKLLVNSTKEELLAAAKNSIEKNKCDIVVANDLEDIKANNHKLLVVDSKNVECMDEMESPCVPLAERLVDYISEKKGNK